MILRDPRRRPYWAERRPVAAVLLTAFLLTLVMEMLSRRDPLAGAAWMLRNPAGFFCNFLIVLLTLAPSLLLPRRALWSTAVCTVWLGFAAANCIVLGFRVTPVSAIDVKMLWSSWPLIMSYLSPVELVLLALAVLALVLLFVRVAMRGEKHKPALRRGAGLFAAAGLLLALLVPVCQRTGALSESFANLGDAYRAYGFSYCLSCSLVDRGVDKPAGYSEETVQDAVEVIESEPEPAPDPVAEDTHPNVLFVQLESYFDPARVKGLTYAEDPIPVFRALRATCSDGWLTVPSVGAGTANSEFEVLTGMSLDYFGAGEYPYETILQKTACESLCTDLKAEGYTTHAIHNHSGSFYDRNSAFASLGFDTFCPVEYMQNVPRNAIGWAHDYILTGEIGKALDSTAGRDLVYTISVQAHGKYPRTQLDGAPYMDNAGFGDEAERWAWGYYLTQLQATDAFIGDLVRMLGARAEPCVLVLYGDHLPNFDIAEEDLRAGTTFQTEYLIWSNFGLEQEDKDLYAYQLSAELLGRLGMEGGVLTQLHQGRADNEDYQQTLELLEYDLLYGDRTAIGGAELRPTDMKMGTTPVTVTGVERIGRSVFIAGSGFTESSVVLLNGHRHSTLLLSGEDLMVSGVELSPGDTVAVAQVGNDHFLLGRTEDYIVPEG